MSAFGLHKLAGGQFIRFKPNLCPNCKHFRPDNEWYGKCLAHRKLLSNPKTEKGRCKLVEARTS